MDSDSLGPVSLYSGSCGHGCCSDGETLAICLLLALATGLHCTLPPFLLGLYMLMHPRGPIGWQGPEQEALVWQCTVAFGVAALVEFIADKVPYLDHGVHVLLLVAAPAVACGVVSAVLTPECAGETGRTVLMFVCGVLAFSTHACRGAARGYGTALHGGALSPCHSLLEDVLAVLLVVGALEYRTRLVMVLAVGLVVAEVFVILWCTFLGVRLCMKGRSDRVRNQAPAASPLQLPLPPASQALAGQAFAVLPPSAPPHSPPLLAPLLPAN
uniref:DUF4126 domain-containing protein n=1 Tax=Alexandrium monilatum TaxID=311494 RepID=A0A7S4VGA2_9DINO